MALAAGALLSGSGKPPERGQLYLNVGHTGLNEPSLPQWVEQYGLRAVYFIHDLIPLTHPQYCRPGEVDKHARRIENVLSSASGVIGNSQATLNDLGTFAAERGLPMPSAVASFIAGPSVPANLAPAVLERPYFIAVGTIEGRKNHLLLLRIWERLARRFGPKTPLLVIVGQRGWEAAEALTLLDRSAFLKDHVRELGTCADDELSSLIAGARALLMPSFAEGFGLPVAEALQLGTPVLASNLPVFREFAGDIPTYLDVLDDLGWERAIVSFAGESADRKRQRRAMKDFNSPDWQSHFMVVDQWLKTLPEGR
jgi:glycosyltransferase involved in cell wall biosynthesis